jgi:SAM-dependent methyltransferase
VASESREAAVERLLPFAERARGFSGWKFGVDARHLGPPLPWNYEDHVRGFARGVASVLDMGTGGGERLAEFRDALPPLVVATEAWSVNAPVAHQRLTPLGVDVVYASEEVLPFATNAFDLIINRHASIDPVEVDRVLRSGGAFVTQQVGRGNWGELAPHFPRMHDFGDELGRYSQGFRDLGFNITVHQHFERVAVPSLGDFVYMLSVASWTIPDFDVERDIDALLALERDCLSDEGFVVTEERYLLTARKPAY